MLSNNRGILLIFITSVATLWLGVTGQLALYIHPRYNLFTIALSIAGLMLAIFSLNIVRSKLQYLHIGLIVIAFATLIILPPQTLSSSVASQRGINTASTTESIAKLAQGNVYSPFGGQMLDLSIKDWSNLLAQTNDPAFFEGKKTTITGFIAPDEQKNANVFYASRFIVNCCAVDARPVGVPIKSDSWATNYKSDQWVTVSGTYGTRDGRILLIPESIKVIEQPKDPYVY